jgi:CSLREA domain-containing protein
MSWRRAALSLPLLVISSIALLPLHSRAATLTVTKVADTNDGTCGADCSLREAVIAANAAPGPDAIALPGGNYELTLTGTGEDLGATGDLDIRSKISVTAVRGRAIIDAAQIDRVLQVHGPGGEASLSGLWLTRGFAPGNEDGGGILSSGAVRLIDSVLIDNRTDNGTGGGIDTSGSGGVTLIDSVVKDNSAGPNSGGGIYSHSGPLSIRNTLFLRNSSGSGGGIRMEAGSARIVDSAFISNNALGSGGIANGGNITALLRTTFEDNSGIQGGALLNFGTIGTISGSTFRRNFGGHFGGGAIDNQGTITLLETSTFSDNRTQGEGGGIYQRGTITTLRNSTFSGNSAAENGGAINNEGTVTIRGITVTGNVADEEFGFETDGGGLFIGGGTLSIGNSIIEGNTDNFGTIHPDCSGTVTSTGHNLIGDDTGCTGFTQPTDDEGPVALGPLGHNGGLTQTHGLPAGSAAVNHGPAGGGGADQRGVPRPQGARQDTGAYERAFCSGVLVNVVGTPRKDVLSGTIDADGVLALGGGDTVRAGGEPDAVCGGPGNDKLFGEAGNDRLLGEGGGDLLDGGPGVDECVGGSGRNRFRNC